MGAVQMYGKQWQNEQVRDRAGVRESMRESVRVRRMKRKTV